MSDKVNVSDTRTRDLSKDSRKLNSLSVKCSRVLIDTLSGENKDYSKRQLIAAKYILEIIMPLDRVNEDMGEYVRKCLV